MNFKSIVKKYAKQFMTEYVTPEDIEYLKDAGFTLVAKQSFVESIHEELKNTNEYWKEIIKFKKESSSKYGDFDLDDEEEVKNAELIMVQEEIDKLFEKLGKAA
jgi:hypothetical protein